MISVDVPEPIGTEHFVGPFSFSQIIRMVFLSFPIIILSIYVSIYFVILIPVIIFLVIKKYNGTNLDILIGKAIIYYISPRVRNREDVLKTIDLRSLSNESLMWEYNEGFMCAIETSGISMDFMDDESKKNIYNMYCKFLDSLNFPISIYIYSFREYNEFNSLPKNEYLKKVLISQKNLVDNLNAQIFKKKFVIIISLKYRELDFRRDLQRAREILNERAEIVLNFLYSINIKSKRMKFSEYAHLYPELW